MKFISLLPGFKSSGQTCPGKQRLRKFNLLQSYAIISFLVMATIGLLTSYLFSSNLASSLLTRDAEVLQEFLQSLTVLTKTTPSTDNEAPTDRHPNSTKPGYDLTELIIHISTMPGIIRANLYTNTGRVAWSTQPELIGKKFPDNRDLTKALEGTIGVELKNIKELAKEEHALFAKDVSLLVENYLPIWNSDHSAIAAVVEIYKAPTSLFESIRTTRNLVWFGEGLATLFLYMSLLWIVHRGNLIIRDQQLKLVESETMVAIGEMASTVAHSIRNPLAAIRSSAELTAEISQNATTRESAQDIMVEADRLGQWVRELLAFSRPDSSLFRAVRLGEILNHSIKGYERLMKRSNITLVRSGTPSVPAINGDAAMLGQMFNSVLANAIEAMPNGGTLSIDINFSASENTVNVAISDTGYGIPKERQEHIFERHSTTKQGGLGIGMSLVKRIAERHAGNISLRSETGCGTTVFFSFLTE